MDWDELLGRRFAARWAFGLIGFALVLLFVVRFAVLPRVWTLREPLGPFNSTYPNAMISMIDAAVTTLLSIGFAGGFLILLVPREVREGRIVTVHPKDIDAELKAGLATTREYFFKGRSARYFRAVVLPVVIASSKATSSARVFWLLLPDPRDDELMDGYARFRNAAAFKGRPADWTAWEIRKEIVAALIAFAREGRRNPHLVFHVGLARSFSILRVNMTDAVAVLTRDDPKLPAFKAARGTVFYESFREDIQLSIGQAGEVDLASLWPDDVPIADAAVLIAMQRLGLADDAGKVDRVAAVAAAVVDVANPYA